MLIEILDDVFFIEQRIKEIFSGYRIFFNTKKQKFEIHNVGQIGGSYCLTVPFQHLDERTLDLVLKTRIENKVKLIDEIDKENEKIRKNYEKTMLNDAKDRLFDQIKYSKF